MTQYISAVQKRNTAVLLRKPGRLASQYAVEVMASFKPFDGCVNGVAFDVYNEYQYVTYGLPEVLRKIRKGLKESLT